jgi:uncharacterized protein (TIGR02118 family)
MKKILIFIKRKAGLTLNEFKVHYEETHVPLAIELCPFISQYVRNYVVPNAIYAPAHLPTAPDFVEPAFDVVSEISFDTSEDYQRMVDTLSDSKMAKVLAADEERFMDRSKIVMYFVDEVITPAAILSRAYKAAAEISGGVA